MIAIDNEPLNIVERSGLKRLLNEILPRYAIPSRPYFSEKIIPELYGKVVTKIKKKLEDTDYISITTDLWTCLQNSVSFLSFTAHWLDRDFNLTHAALNVKHFEGQHTAQNIANALQEILSRWECPLSKIHVIVHDNGRNIVKAVSEAKMNSACCFIHTLQLVIKDSLKIQPEIGETIAVGRKIVTHFNHSSTAQEKLKKIQEELGIAKHNLVQDITTRWNSTFYMLERLLEQKRAISLYLTDTVNISNLTAEQWEIVDQLLKLLKPFEEITKITSSNYSCLSEIIPHVVTLNRYCNKAVSSDLAPKLKFMAIAMQQGIKQRFSQIDDNKNYLISTLLDPRFKTNFFTNQLQKERARQYILVEDLVSDYDTSSDESVRSSPVQSKRKRTDEPGQSIRTSFWECYDEVVAENFIDDDNGVGIASISKNIITGDLDKNLNIKTLKGNDDPFAWWAAHKSKFSQCLVKLTVEYLSAPASSVYSERLFSEAGNVYEGKRNRLLPKNAEKLIFLHHNLPLIDFSYNK
ncbi:zinc finger BED domain-containing protein 4-like [Centruroides sculpturatus]|uniref:zinc finger BED domain-containing protein 4-like n=1 Tax=Centruroides sculpturatus TaxID=218467 RepID=UPI000C6DE7AF|nr:zinc finger BED domain-containing protein 4-like [Centruroides sculpturatus]